MPAKSNMDATPADLRRRAEKRVRRPATGPVDADAQRALHELEVHQIELEMQNAELRTARDEAEALRDKYTELYDFAPVGYFTLGARGTIRLVNLTGASMVGKERSKLIGRSFGVLLANRDRAGFKTLLEQAFAGDAKRSADFELADPTREIRDVNLEARCSPSGLECSIIIQDITRRRQAQEQMRLSEIRYRRLFEETHDGILLVDPESRQIIDANPFMTQLLGYPREQLIGKELYQIGLLEDEAASRAMLRALKRSHEVRYEDLPLESQAGDHQEVEVVANLYQENGRSVIQCNIRDITARKLAEDMSRRNVKLNREITRRKVLEEDLRANRKEQSRLLRQSRLQQKQLRDLSHQILKVQEDERKRISHELHDVIAQTLVSISVHLEILVRRSTAVPECLRHQICRTQLLVERAVEIVHGFARELRPTMLDDLGLVPALQAYVQRFTQDTQIRVTLNASRKIDRATSIVRTVIFRVVQEALTNVARHSKASLAEVNIKYQANVIRMEIRDNGQGFKVSGKAGSHKKGRLGLIGMRERVEMIDGTFQVQSAPGGPTTIQVKIPATN